MVFHIYSLYDIKMLSYYLLTLVSVNTLWSSIRFFKLVFYGIHFVGSLYAVLFPTISKLEL